MGHLFDWNQIAGAAPRHFGDPRRELEAARSTAALCPLGHFGLLRFSGGDAGAFLQGQLTCDLNQVTPSGARFGGYCTPKGRLLADFLLFATPQEYLMHLPAELSAPIAGRLRKFVLRSRVSIESETGLRTLGVAGPGAVDLLRQTIGEPPRMPLELVHYGRVVLLRLPGAGFLVLAPMAEITQMWDRLAQKAVPAGTDCWDWLQIRAGIPWITGATQEQFVPQMVGLDAIGGVSFQKGCYPGQEIVARAHYLGEVKRRLCSGHADDSARAGDTLVLAGRSCGTVVNAAPAPGGGSDLLAVVQIGAETEDLWLRSADGSGVKVSPLIFV